MEHGKDLFYFCMKWTRDRIDHLGVQALLGHTNSPIEKCRSHTTLTDRLPRHDLCARARVCAATESVGHCISNTRDDLCAVHSMDSGTAVKLTTSQWMFAMSFSYVQGNWKLRRDEKEENRILFGRGTRALRKCRTGIILARIDSRVWLYIREYIDFG